MFPTRTLSKNNTVYIFLHYHMTSAAGGQVALSLFIIMPPPPFTFNNILFPLLYNCLLHPMPPELRLCQTNLYHLLAQYPPHLNLASSKTTKRRTNVSAVCEHYFVEIIHLAERTIMISLYKHNIIT